MAFGQSLRSFFGIADRRYAGRFAWTGRLAGRTPCLERRFVGAHGGTAQRPASDPCIRK